MADIAILGGDAVRGDPAALRQVASLLKDTADQVGVIRGTLASANMHGQWEGAASQAFHNLLQTTPTELEQAGRSYGAAAHAVLWYAGELDQRKAIAEDLARRIAGAEQQSAGAEKAFASASHTVDVARRAYRAATDAAARTHAQSVLDQALRVLARADDARRSLHNQTAQLRRQAHDNRQALNSAAHRAQDLLRDASHAGLRNDAFSWFGRHVEPGLAVAAKFTGEVIHDVVDQAVNTFKDAVGILGALDALIRDPSWANFSKALDHFQAVLTILAVVAAIALIVVSGGTAAPAMLLLVQAVAVTQTATAAVKLNVDAVRQGRGEKVDLKADVIDLFGSAAGSAATLRGAGMVSAKVAATTDKGWITRYYRYGPSGQAPKTGIASLLKPLGVSPKARTIASKLVDPLEHAVVQSAKDHGLELGIRTVAPYIPTHAPTLSDLGTTAHALVQSRLTQFTHTIQLSLPVSISQAVAR